MILEYGNKIVMDFLFIGIICNFWDWCVMLGGSSGGLLVVVVFGMGVLLLVIDGGGLICVLVCWSGVVGFKLMFDFVLIGVVGFWIWLFMFGLIVCNVCDIVLMFSVVLGVYDFL